MKEIELKNCPNCKKRIGKHDIECPFCNYIDDPKYKKHNEKLKKRKTKKKEKEDIYKIILFMPIITCLVGLLLELNKYFVISLLILNILSLFIKRKNILWILIIELIILSSNFIINILNRGNIKNEIIIYLLGLIFIIIPKIVYCFKAKKKRTRKVKK